MGDREERTESATFEVGTDAGARVETVPGLACPACGVRLLGSLKCPACGVEYRMVDGVVDLAPPRQDYVFTLRSVPVDSFHALLERMRAEGWPEAYEAYLQDYFRGRRDPTGLRRKLRDTMLGLRGRSVPGVVRAILCRSQAYHWLLTGVGPDSVVLDLGAGWSAMSHVLAGECAQLVASDVTLERLQFSALRAQATGVRNMSFVRTPTELPLPFVDETFDLVVINGVLEWVPASSPGDPEAVQRAYLKEVCRILRPEGQVIVGIENRYALSDLMGFPEGHVGLPLVGVVPRRLGDLYSRITRKRPLRVATHSRRGLARLLESAGFPRAYSAFYAPQPTYSWYDSIAGLDERASELLGKGALEEHPMFRRRVRSRPARRALSATSGLVGAFYAVAGKKGTKPSLRELCDQVSKEAGLSLEFPIGPMRVREHKVTARARLRGDTRAVYIAVGMSRLGNDRVECEYRTLQAIRSAKPDSTVVVPIPLFHSTFRKHTVSFLGEIHGRPVPESAEPSRAWDHTLQAVDFLDQLAELMPTSGALPPIAQLWERRWAFLFDLCWTTEQREKAVLVEELLRPPQDVLQRTAEFGHGDLLVGNILYDETNDTVGVIDWESAGPAYPSEDEVTVLVSHGRDRFGGIGPTFSALLDRSNGSRPPSWLSRLARRTGAGGPEYDRAVVMAWLGHVVHASESYVLSDPKWLGERVWSVLDACHSRFVKD